MKKFYFTQLFAAILLLCSTLTANAEKVTGYAGLGVEWELDTESGELVFSGFGDMYLMNKVYSSCHFKEYKEQIKSVKIGRNIKSISPYLFDGLTNLESIDIPSSIEQIAEYIIDDARSTFEGTAWWNNQPDGLVYLEDWLIGYKGEKPAGEITIKDGTKGICQRAFSRCEEITKVILPSSVQYIRYSAFYGCTSLTDISLPEGLLYINDRAFGNCSSLANISIPSSVIHISDDVFDGTAWHNSQPDGLIYIDNWFYGFKGEAPAGELVIADETKGIAGGALYGCKELTTVSLPESIKSIGSFAFDGCGIETITVPHGVQHIGRFAFEDCVNLREFAFSHWMIAIKTIELNILSGCNNLESIGETAGAYIFKDNCIYTSEYHHEHSETILLGVYGTKIPQGVDYIDSYAFYGNEKVTEIVVPNGVKSISEMAFGRCPNLTSITLPASITHTGPHITNGQKLDVHISDLQAWCNIEFVAPESTPLYYTSNLYLNGELVTYLVIPAGITEIKKSTFSYCNSITSVTIPQGVTSIKEYAFSNCDSIKSITSRIPAEELFAVDNSAFSFTGINSCTLYVPAGAKATYAATEGWNRFTNIVEMIAEPFTLTVSAARYATLYLDYDAVIPAGVRVYYAEKIEGETLLMERITDVIPANTAVIVTGAAGTYAFEQTTEPVAAIENNLFCGSVEDTYITPEKGTKYYVLSMVDGVVGMYRDELAGDTFKNNAFKAYLPLNGESLGIFDTTVNAPDVQLSNRYTFNFGGVTAVEVVNAEKASEAIYNLNGQRVENPTKGIYIVNGKKVVY